MAAPGSTPIIIYHTTTASAQPSTSNLNVGELAINVTDQKVYSKNGGGSLITLVGTLGNQEASSVAITGGSINGTTIGASTRSTGAFTTLTSNGATTFTAGTASTTTTTGTAVITGGLGVSGRINAANIDGIIGANTAAAGTFTNLAYTGTLTGGTGVINIGSGQVYKDASGNVGIGTSSPVSNSLTLTNTRFLAWLNSSGAFTGGSTGGSIFKFSDNNLYVDNYDSASIIFRRNSYAESMRIDSSGNVGIGTSTIAEKLDVNGNIYLRPASPVVYSGGTITLQSGSASPLVFNTDAGSERMRITSGGEVYIAGTTDQGAYNLQVNGTGVWGAGAYVNGSDARIKKDIEPISSSLDVINKLNPVTYKYKENWTKDRSTQTGFIAQELLVALEGQNYVDGIVQQGGEYMSVAYQNIIPILTKAIQELNAKVEALEAQLNKE